MTAPTTYNGGGEDTSSTLPNMGYGTSPSISGNNGNDMYSPNPSPIGTTPTNPIPSSYGEGGYPVTFQNSADQMPNPSPVSGYSGLYPSISTQAPFDLFPSKFNSDTGIISESSNSPAVESSDLFFAKFPSVMPSPLPRETILVDYIFCLEHGILVPIFEVLSETSKSITQTLTELFNDDVQVMSDQWSIDEQHLRVLNVDTVWLESPPPKLECKF